MKLSNPSPTRALIATITTGASREDVETVEILPGETYETDDYVIASTLVEYGAVGDREEIAAARELWAATNRARNSRTASASASEGKILERQAQTTADVATGTVDPGVSGDLIDNLKGAALTEAVRLANEGGATIDTRGTAAEKREALKAYAAGEGVDEDDDDKFLVDENGDLVLDDEGQPYAVTEVERDEDGEVVYDEDGRPVRLADSTEGDGDDAGQE